MSARVVIAGGHGKIALLLARVLADRGDTAVGLIRDPGQVDDLRAAGAHAVVIDLEHSSVAEVAGHLEGADAVVFAAGAGPGSTVERKETVDRDGAILLADAAVAAGVRRYVMVSAMGTDAPADAADQDPVFAAYLRAKAAADANVRGRRELRSTIVRPGKLTDDPATGEVEIAESTGRGSISRADVAAVLGAVLATDATAGVTFEVVDGTTAIADAVAALKN